MITVGVERFFAFAAAHSITTGAVEIEHDRIEDVDSELRGKARAHDMHFVVRSQIHIVHCRSPFALSPRIFHNHNTSTMNHGGTTAAAAASLTSPNHAVAA